MNMSQSVSKESIPGGVIISATIGIILGLTQGFNPHSHSFYNNFIVPFITAWGLLALFSYNGINNKRLLLTSLGAALCISMMFYYYNICSSMPESIAYPMYINIWIATYMIHCFHWAYHQNNSYHYQYTTLFDTVWDSFCLSLFSGIFTLLTSLIIYLIGALFKSVLMTSVYAFYPSPYFLFSIGIFLGRKHFNITKNLRWLLLQSFYYIYPFFAILMIIFLIGVFSRGNFILFFTLGARSLFVYDKNPSFLYIAILGIIFLNAAYQDGSAHIAYPKPILICLKIFTVTLPFFAIFGGLYYHYQDSVFYQHPSNPLNYIGIVFLIFYTIAYAVAAIYSKDKKSFSFLPRINIILAIGFVLVALCVNNPFFDPFSLEIYKPKIGESYNEVDVTNTFINLFSF